MQILRKSEEMIYPAAPACSHPALHRLSEIDQARMTIPKLLFYTQGPPSSETLKSSLSKTLALFYPLAGRLVERSAEISASTATSREGDQAGMGSCEGACHVDGRVDVSCLDQGAIFCEAWTDTCLDAYMPDFQPHPDYELLVVPDRDDVPLRVQVTYFACGGICLCVQALHALVDGTSSAHFMECWVEFANGNDSVVESPYIIHPRLEVMYRPKEPCNSCMEDISSNYQGQGQRLDVKGHDTQPVLNRIFHFTPEFIDLLKRQSSGGDSCKYSSFECITAYMWRNMIRAQGIAPYEEVCLYYMVSGRRKLEPPLPRSYFGNVVFITDARAKVSDLVDKPLSHLTQLIRTATSKITDEQMRTVLNWLAAKKVSQAATPMERKSTDFQFTSWTTFPLCDLNFGWGNPTCCRLAHVPLHCGVILPSSLGKGHIDVLVSLKQNHMYTLESLISPRLLE